MLITFDEISKKEIINVIDGYSFGFADDMVFDTETKKAVALVIESKPKFLRAFSKDGNISINWDKIENIGIDTILVKTEHRSRTNCEKVSFIQKILNIFFY